MGEIAEARDLRGYLGATTLSWSIERVEYTNTAVPYNRGRTLFLLLLNKHRFGNH